MLLKSMLMGTAILRDAEGAGGGGGEGGGGGGDDVQARIDKAVEEAVAGLKGTNADLKAEKTELKNRLDGISTQFESLGGEEGLKKLLEMQERLAKDEVGKLLAEGKHDEWFDKRAAPMVADYEKRLAAEVASKEEAIEKLKGSDAKLHSTLLDVGIGKACDKAEITAPAIRDHVKMLAEREFVFDAELGTHVIRDPDGGVVCGKDGKTPKTMVEWIEERKGVPEYRDYWWPGSKGAGLHNGTTPGNPQRRMEAVGEMGMPEFRKFWAEQQKAQ